MESTSGAIHRQEKEKGGARGGRTKEDEEMTKLSTAPDFQTAPVTSSILVSRADLQTNYSCS